MTLPGSTAVPAAGSALFDTENPGTLTAFVVVPGGGVMTEPPGGVAVALALFSITEPTPSAPTVTEYVTMTV